MKRFWSKVDIKDKSECWEWGKHINNLGYGKFWFDDKWQQAHRVAFILSGGILTKEKPFVLHKCDNRKCVNPEHLYAGNQTDNMKDRSNKGRWSCGEQHGENGHNVKLTKRDVIEIRMLCETKKTSHQKIADRYGITRSNVGCIYQRKSWTNI
jgi:predicted XRE-type DNA-binding protein